ncbi:ABC transporter substrate-binding protein [Saccharopolyspora gloriosae]|uniref:Peptide/nickel transport system substrate-binding protein n=1 Tax=Saccharopolyspora gloriosae TaxID=455344 RepID=A0A840NEZ3_9PSEU|nr:ABC transporter substrate-binding protein [Saccharopolyspora gloriosae]MBB5068843.1 peptide/nickel transport system substrate-binding protein [Saccharopolyspora gloriosae]
MGFTSLPGRAARLPGLVAESTAALLVVALAAGCSAADGAAPDDDGVIEYAHEQEPPCVHGGWVQNAYLARQYLDNLVSLDSGGEVVPWLAQRWEISPDQRTYTFHLKPGVRFTDGTPLDAAAVRENFERYLDPETQNSTVFAYIGEYYERGEAVDARTFRMHLTKPYAPLLTVLTQGYFGIQSPTALARGTRANCEQPVGSGPFRIESWERNQQITFVRNENYTSAPANAKHQGPAYARKLEWKFLKDPTSRYGSLSGGESDVIYNVPAIDWGEARERFEVQQYITPGRPVALNINVSRAPFDDVRVRRAFAHSADWESAVRAAFFDVVPHNGNGALSSTPLHDPEFSDAHRRDVPRANALLDEAGWTGRNEAGYRVKDGVELHPVIVYPAGAVIGPEGVALLQNIQQMAKDTGFHVELLPATQSEYFGGKYSSPDSYNAITGYWTSPTPGLLYINWRRRLPERPNPQNNTFYDNPELERLISRANSTLDPAEQRTLYSAAQRIISEDAVAIGLYTQTTSLAVRPGLRDVWIEKSQGEPVFHDARFVR